MSAEPATDDLAWRPMAIAAAVAFVAGLGMRWWVMNSRLGFLNSDEAVTGLLGYDVIHGHPSLLFGGSTYGSTVEAWLAAPLIAIFGGSRVVLKTLNVAEWVVASCVVYWAFRHLLGRVRSLALASLLWIQSGAFVALSTVAYLGYASGLIFGAAGLGFLVRSIDDVRRDRATVLAGVFCGLAVWCHPLYLVPLVPAAMGALWRRHRDNVTTWIWRAGAGGVLGLAPLIIANVRNGGAGLKSPPQTTITTYRERIDIVLAQLTPRALGLRTPNGQWLVPRRLGMVAVLAAIALSIFGLVRLARRHRGGLVVAAAGLPAVLLLPVFPNTWYPNDSRYFTPIAVPFLVGLIGLTLARHAIAAAPRVRPASALAAGVLVWGALSCGLWIRREAPHRVADPDGGLGSALSTLDKAGVKGVIGQYWAVYRVSYGSDNRIAASVQQSLNDGSDRFARMQRKVESLPAREVAYVYLGGADHLDQVPGNGVDYSRVEVGGLIMYLPKP
jgi:Dolichyl-phosphate-mannose-protein mannosyltransferase